VSDQDFFFDDDEPKPAKSTKPASGKSTASKAKPAASSAKTTARKPAADAAPSQPAPSGGFMDQSMGMPVVSLLVVIGVLVGVIFGFLLGGAVQNQSVSAPSTIGAPAASGTGTTGTGTPGQLTPAQIQQGLPAGHPAVSGAATPTAP
jgi:hypothetical protein